jgi:parvulin-like peptidyl-prolyl isomerase
MFASLLLVALPWIPAAVPQDPDPELDGSKPVLSIDGHLISADEYARWLIDTGGASFARDFAERWVILREAERRGIEITDEMVRAEVEEPIALRIEHAFRGEKEAWLAELERLGRTEGGHRRQMMTDERPNVAAKALAALDRVVPEDKIARDWELHYGPYGLDAELRLMNFQVEVETGEDAEAQAENTRRAREEQLARAELVRGRLLAGEDFAELARQFCSDPALAESGGVPAKPFRRGQNWPSAFIDRVLALEVGELSEPLYARGGWWLVRLEGLTETPLASVRDELEAALIAKGPEQDEIGRVWNALTEDVYYELHPELFESAPSLEGREALAMTVDGEPIPRRVFAAWLLWIRGEFQATHFAQDWLVMQRAQEAGVEISDEAAMARVESYIEWLLSSDPRYRGSREAWVASLSVRGRTVEDFLREKAFRARLDLMAQELILRERVVSEADVRAEFERQFGSAGRWLEVRLIQVDVEPPDVSRIGTREELDAAMLAAGEAARQEAAGYAERLRAGEDFATLARRHSDDPASAAEGGRLAGRFRGDAWSPEVAAAVRALELGQVSAPLYDGRSYYVFELVVDRQVDFEAARDELYSELAERQPSSGAIAAYRNVLTKNADVRLLPGMWD